MYITYYKHSFKPKQMTFAELYQNFQAAPPPYHPIDEFEKFTAIVNLNEVNKSYYLSTYPIAQYYEALKFLVNENRRAGFIDIKEDMSEYYSTFQIPKRAGGFRTIEAPNDALKTFQDSLKVFFDKTCQALPHNAAYAYVKHRAVKDALEKHKNSNWFLKLDIHGFFPSCNMDCIYNHIAEVFPFSLLKDYVPAIPTPFQQWDTFNRMIPIADTQPTGSTLLKTAISYALLNNHLPQGTPLSPVLTNLMMVPFDTELSRILPKEMVYTRYADDMLISSPYAFDWQKIQNQIKDLLATMQYTFQLNENKTRYGSINGRNWNLGLMLNKDHNITLGHDKKQRYKAAIFNFCNDLTNGRTWDRIDVQVLTGQLAYGKNIEPEYFNALIQKYNQKFNIDFAEACKAIINS